MYINVLIETKVSKNDMTFTYHVPDDLGHDLIGKRVLVPFNNRIIEGFVISYCNKPEKYEVKDIISVIDKEVVLNEELLKLGKFMSEKYLCSLIYAYQAMLPKALKASHKSKKTYLIKTFVKLNENYDDSDIKIKAQKDIIDLLKNNSEVLKSEIKSKSSLKKLIDKKIVIEYDKEVYREVKTNLDERKITLTKRQEETSKKLKSYLNKSSINLLYGVT